MHEYALKIKQPEVRTDCMIVEQHYYQPPNQTKQQQLWFLTQHIYIYILKIKRHQPAVCFAHEICILMEDAIVLRCPTLTGSVNRRGDEEVEEAAGAVWWRWDGARTSRMEPAGLLGRGCLRSSRPKRAPRRRSGGGKL